MKLIDDLRRYQPYNEQEVKDKALILEWLEKGESVFTRNSVMAHMTTSAWVVNKSRDKVLMAYHNIYDSWSWIGGHADGAEDLPTVALRELQEETGVHHAALVSRDIFSLEILPVSGHIKKGVYVPSHLHLNITYLAEADENEALTVNEVENQAVKWWSFADALQVSKELWFVERVYKKLIEKCKCAS